MADGDLGPYSGRRGTRWGRLFLGLLFVATATFVAAYYVPLYRAHQRLAAQYSEVNQRTQQLNDQLGKAQSELKAASDQRDRLQAEHDQGESSQKSRADQLEHARAALSTKLDKLVKKGAVAVVVDTGALFVVFDSATLFLPQKLDVNPGLRSTLCDVVKSSEAKSVAAHGAIADGAVVPPALAASYPGAFGLTAARAAAVAQVLQETCQVPAAQLSATGDGSRVAAARSSSIKSGDRVELELTFR